MIIYEYTNKNFNSEFLLIIVIRLVFWLRSSVCSICRESLAEIDYFGDRLISSLVSLVSGVTIQSSLYL